MALKNYAPTTSSRRGLIQVDRSHLWKGKPEKSLTEGKSGTGGRNNYGRITSWHRGGGHKCKYRLIDFKRRRFDMPAKVERIEYDPNRTAHIALIRYEDDTLSYIIAPQKLEVGDTVMSGPSAEIKPGNALPLRNMPVGSVVHNVELKAGKGGQLARSAGTFIQFVGKSDGKAMLRLRSGEMRVVDLECMATIGIVSNPELQNTTIAKAGRSRWKGKRPVVRGVAMNPIDHPHGGGEGKSSGGRHPVTPWGKSTKGKRTRNNKRTDKVIIRRRYQK